MTYAATVLSYSPLVYLRMQESAGTTAADASGNGRTGTYTDNYTLNQTSSPITNDAAARSVLFDGSDSYIDGSYNPFSGQKTFIIWAKRTDTSGYHSLFGGDQATGTPMLRLNTGDQQIQWAPDSSNTIVTFDTNWPSDAAWHMAMLTFDDSTFDSILYVDGVKDGATKNVGNGYGTTPGNYQVSGRGTFQDCFKGNLAEFAIVNGILVASDALAIYNAATAVAAAGRPSVWNGSAWVKKPAKVWNGSAWVEKPMKRWNGSSWVALT